MSNLTRSRVLGVVGILWGGAIVVRGVWGGIATSDTAFGGGQMAGLVLGIGFVVAGIWAVAREQ